ncbi:predicted protein, partial [Nematostella vectensis]
VLMFGLLYVIGFVGNAVVLWIVNKKKNEGKAIYLFIGALAFSDILMVVLSSVTSLMVTVLGKWPFSDTICQFQGFLVVFLATVSLLLMAGTAVNRYFQVVRTNFYRLIFTPMHTRLLVGGIWVLASIAPIQYVAIGERYIFHPGKCFCFQENSFKPSTLFVSVIVFIPMCFIIASYYKVFKTIQSHKHRVANMQNNADSIAGPNIQDVKVTRTLFVTVVGFLCCWTPILIMDLIEFARGILFLPRELYILYSWLGLLSTVINPLIYGVMNPMFREEYKKIL